MKKLLFVAAIAAFASCKKCEDCTVTITVGGSSTSSTTEEYCGDDLDAVKESAGTTTTSGVTYVTTVDCK